MKAELKSSTEKSRPGKSPTKKSRRSEARCPSQKIAPNVGACAVAGIGGLGNEAKRNAKTDQLRPVPRYNINKENESYEDTEPGYCTSTVLAAAWPYHNFTRGSNRNIDVASQTTETSNVSLACLSNFSSFISVKIDCGSDAGTSVKTVPAIMSPSRLLGFTKTKIISIGEIGPVKFLIMHCILLAGPIVLMSNTL